MKKKHTAHPKQKNNKSKFDHKSKFGKKKKKLELENNEIQQLQTKYKDIVPGSIETFADFPLCQKTQQGLKQAGYTKPTEIQREAIGLALQGYDILGAAKTGSGKTLAFLIPILEGLYNLKWNPNDEMGALIITPTRELAYQIFEVLRKVGKYHDFSAGLVIGGKRLKEEAERIRNTNIVICTPGRLLQHMDETYLFHADNLKFLVLDEADRILDLGFAQSMNAIIENLPSERQTLLFSATQTKSVKDLARLSLEAPMYVSVHENATHSTPTQLTQSYIVCPAEDKMDLLWSFLQSHPRSKILVFMSTCKQVRYIHESFRKLRPSYTVLALHGLMQQLKRVDVYDQFCRKQNCVLFATDIAARGLDFPAVHWVVQLDCPEDANTYIHRAGRTARYETDGEALLVLTPDEENGMIEALTEKKIPINKIKVNPRKKQTITGKLMSQCAADVQLKEFAQRAFQSYLKSIFIMSNKSVFDVKKIDTEKYARSLGLVVQPRVRFIQNEKKRQQALLTLQMEQAKETEQKDKNKLNKSSSKSNLDKDSSSSDNDDEDSSSDEESESSQSDSNDTDKLERKLNNQPQTLTDNFNFNVDDETDDLFTVKKKVESRDDEEEDILEPLPVPIKDKKLTKAAIAKRTLKKNLQVNKKVVFDEEGEKVLDVHKEVQEDSDDEDTGGIKLEEARQRLIQADKIDKELARQKIKAQHKEKRLKEKEERRKKKRVQKDEPDDASDASDDDDDFPDLPDPDKYYGPEKTGSDNTDEDGISDSDYDSDRSDVEVDSSDIEEDSNSAIESSSEEEDEPPKKKRKGQKNCKQMGVEANLADDELLALQLLQS